MQMYIRKSQAGDILTGNALAKMASQCVADTELVYTEHKEMNVQKTMLLVAMPACCNTAAGEHTSRCDHASLAARVLHASDKPYL